MKKERVVFYFQFYLTVSIDLPMRAGFLIALGWWCLFVELVCGVVANSGALLDNTVKSELFCYRYSARRRGLGSFFS